MKWIALALLVACGGNGKQLDGLTMGDGATSDAPAIAIPPNTWTFVPVAGTTCGDGSPAAIAVNGAPTASGEMFVYFEGGGACWDENTCFTLKSAVKIDKPYDQAAFQTDLPALQGTPIFDRNASANPFKNATYVFVPYCTGDLHAGMRVATYGAHTVHHTGRTNAQSFVDGIKGTLPALQRIWVTGSSAGGYGATLDMDLFATAWPAAQVHVLQDSSPFVDVLAAYDTWRSAWSLVFPSGCTTCTTSFRGVIDAVVAAHPQSRIGLLTFREDGIIKQFFGYSGSLAPAIDALVNTQYAHPTTHAFELDGTTHTMIGQYATLTGPGGIKLSDWVAQWATGDAAWATVKP